MCLHEDVLKYVLCHIHYLIKYSVHLMFILLYFNLLADGMYTSKECALSHYSTLARSVLFLTIVH